jgi:hypothetical protein
MNGIATYLPAAALLGFALVGGCGHNMEQRAASGAASGAAAGAVVAGPVGAVVGAGAGAVGGAVVNESETHK